MAREIGLIKWRAPDEFPPARKIGTDEPGEDWESARFASNANSLSHTLKETRSLCFQK